MQERGEIATCGMGNKVKIWDIKKPSSIRLKLVLNHGEQFDLGTSLPWSSLLLSWPSGIAVVPAADLGPGEDSDDDHRGNIALFYPSFYLHSLAAFVPAADLGQGEDSDDDQHGGSTGNGKQTNMTWFTRSDLPGLPKATSTNPMVDEAIKKANKDVPEVTQVREGVVHRCFSCVGSSGLKKTETKD